MKIYRVICKSLDADECDNTIAVTTFLDRDIAIKYLKESIKDLKKQSEELDLEDYCIDENETSYERYLAHRAFEDSISIWLEEDETYDEKFLKEEQKEKDNDYEI